MEIALYSEEVGRALVPNLHAFSEPPVGFEFRAGAVCWTEHEGPLEEARYLVVNTAQRRFTFTAPKLISVVGPFILFSGLSDTDPSGTPRSLRKCYILMKIQ